MSGEIDHPYVQRDLKLPGYVPGFLSQSTILSVYGVFPLLVVSFVWILSGIILLMLCRKSILMCWWIFTGLTHIILEGYFAFSPEFYKEKTLHYLAEVWKEYSKGDSRYAGRDSGVVAVEGITAAIEGPACLLAIYAIATKKSYSNILQIAISFEFRPALRDCCLLHHNYIGRKNKHKLSKSQINNTNCFEVSWDRDQQEINDKQSQLPNWFNYCDTFR